MAMIKLIELIGVVNIKLLKVFVEKIFHKEVAETPSKIRDVGDVLDIIDILNDSNLPVNSV